MVEESPVSPCLGRCRAASVPLAGDLLVAGDPFFSPFLNKLMKGGYGGLRPFPEEGCDRYVCAFRIRQKRRSPELSYGKVEDVFLPPSPEASPSCDSTSLLFFCGEEESLYQRGLVLYIPSFPRIWWRRLEPAVPLFPLSSLSQIGASNYLEHRSPLSLFSTRAAHE